MNPFKDEIFDIFLAVLFATVLAVFILNTFGCAEFQKPTFDETRTAYHDLKFKVNGTDYSGVGVHPRQSEYLITVFPEERIDRIIWQTCHQEKIVDRPKTGWFNKSFSFKLKNVQGLEDQNPCPLQITVLSEKSRKMGFGFLEFTDTRPEISLASTTKCNGQVISWVKGVSVCQSSHSLIQEIKFPEPVIQAGSLGKCDVMKSKDRLKYQFAIAEGLCTYYFCSKRKHANGNLFCHRFSTLGYTEVPAK